MSVVIQGVREGRGFPGGETTASLRALRLTRAFLGSLGSRVTRASKCALPILVMALASCVGYQVKPVDLDDYRMMTNSAEAIQGKLDAASTAHSDVVLASREKLKSCRKRIEGSLRCAELCPGAVKDVRADLASFQSETIQLVETAIGRDDVYDLKKPQLREIEGLLQSMQRAIMAIDERLARHLKELQQARLARARNAIDLLGTALHVQEQRLFDKLNKKAAREPGQEESIAAQKKAWVLAVHQWIRVVQDGLVRAAQSGTVGADLIACDSLNVALVATLGEDVWDADRQVWTALALSVLTSLVPTGSMSPETQEIIAVIDDEFAKVVQEYELRHSL